jgi:hypothetical protein
VNGLFLLRFATELDPRGSIPAQRHGIIELRCGQVAFKEPAQVIRAAVESELDRASINGDLHLRRAAERKADVGPACGFLIRGHLAKFFADFAKRDWRLLNQHRTDVAEINVRRRSAFKDDQMPSVRWKINPLRPAYSDQCSSAGFDQESSEWAVRYLFMDLFNHP